MTNEQFDQLVNRIQARYGAHPFALRLRIALLVGLGYSGFLLMLLTVLILAAALAVGAVAVQSGPDTFFVVVIAVLLAFSFCQALVVLWVPMETPKARELKQTEAPQLFRLLETLQTKLQTNRFDHVHFTAEFNAAVQMVPRLGVFGFNRSTLILGLPMMRALSTEQFSAVLAHEFAHSSSRHDRFGMWIYRLRETWGRVFAELQQGRQEGFLNRSRRIIVWFIGWYWPRFNAYAFVLSRANEYEADRVAAEWAGTEAAAAALFRTECFGIRLNDKFWTGVTQLAKTESSVPDDILDRIEAFLRSRPEDADAARWMEQSTKALTGNSDTHPSLSDRLKAMEWPVDRFVKLPFPELPMHSAAEVLLGDDLSEISREVNLLWQRDNALRWQSVFHQARRTEKLLNAVSKPTEGVTSPDAIESATTTPFDADQLWTQAQATRELHGSAAAEPVLRQLLAQQPAHSLANVTLGRQLLERGDVEGELYLRRILEDDDNELVPAACEGLITYFQTIGQADQVLETRTHLSRFETAQAAALKERSQVTAKDRFVDHGLNEQDLQAVLAKLAQESDLGFAWLARKDLKFFPNQRLFVLVVQSGKKGLFGAANPELSQRLAARLITEVKLPGRVLIISSQGGFRALARKVSSIAGTQIFPASSRSQAEISSHSQAPLGNAGLGNAASSSDR